MYASMVPTSSGFGSTTGMVSPAAWIHPGERTGRYRTEKDKLIVNEQGQSEISAEDFAIAVVDELENPRHMRERFTAAW